MSKQLQACLFYQLDSRPVMHLFELARACDATMVQSYRALRALRAKGMVQRVGWGRYSSRQMVLPGMAAPR